MGLLLLPFTGIVLAIVNELARLWLWRFDLPDLGDLLLKIRFGQDYAVEIASWESDDISANQTLSVLIFGGLFGLALPLVWGIKQILHLQRAH